MREISIRSWKENLPSEGVAVVFDIFRCTSTVHCLFSQNPKRIFVAQSLAELRQADLPLTKSAQIFSELSQAIDCAERLDNSPHLALESKLLDPVMIATTTGTPAMFAARKYRKVFLGSLMNFSALIGRLKEFDEPITLIPAAPSDWSHVEDEAAAQAVAVALEGFSDSAKFVRECAETAKANILRSTRVPDLVRKLPHGLQDTNAALDIDRFSFVLDLDFAAAPHPVVARVRGCS